VRLAAADVDVQRVVRTRTIVGLRAGGWQGERREGGRDREQTAHMTLLSGDACVEAYDLPTARAASR
jgi:hypothetical protein